MFAVDDMTTSHPACGIMAEPVGEVAQYGHRYQLCHLRGPAGVIIAPAEQVR